MSDLDELVGEEGQKHLRSLHGAHVTQLSRAVWGVLQRRGYDALVLHSGMPALRSSFDDNYWPLRCTPHYQHWLPLAEPGCALIVEPGKRARLLRTLNASYWEALPAPESAHFWESFDVEEVRSLKDRLPRGRVAFVGEDLRDAGTAETNPKALLAELDQLRVHKTPYEVECLAVANRRAAAGHEQVRQLFAQADRPELELHLAFLGATRQDDVETPYKNIVALGKHAATLHHVAYDKRGHGAQSLLLDAGASFAGYCSDITRTWVKGGGAAAGAFGELVSAVERLQQELCGEARLGRPYEELHDDSHRKVAAALRSVGISKLPADELVANGTTRAFFPHGLGHSLGLQCHDVGCALVKPRVENPWLRNTTTITEGQCFTIEPGIYFIDALLAPLRARADIDWKLVDSLAQMGGIRIEDDLVIGPGVPRNLTRECLPQGGGAAVQAAFSALPPSAS